MKNKMAGMTIFIDAKASMFTRRATKIPSTIEYKDSNNIIIIVGKANKNSVLALKFFAKLFLVMFVLY
jgi:hypothetical protein